MKGMRSEGLRGSILFAIFFAAILLTMAGPSTAQTVTFADANLEAQVRAKLAIAAGTPITVADMLNLSELSASAKGIVSIQGMESAVNLNKLFVSFNQLSDISPMSGLTNLTAAGLSNNKISNVSSLAPLVNLTWLDLGNNQIADISSLAGLTKLTSLNLWKNQVTDISALAGMTDLTSLGLNENFRVNDVTALSALTKLTNLSLQYNKITSIAPLAGLVNLQTLHLTSNQIIDISPLAGMTKLTSFSAQGNKLSNISVLASLTQMTFLDLDYNKISDTTPLVGMRLNYLALDSNQISNLQLGGADLTALEKFSINRNPLVSVMLSDAVLNQQAFDALMNGGHTVYIGLAELPGIRQLDMSGVDFAQVTSFASMYGMDSLDTLLLAGATNVDGGRLMQLIGELDSLALLDLTGTWSTFDAATQNSLRAWDSVEGHDLLIPEPATVALLGLGLWALAVRRRQRGGA